MAILKCDAGKPLVLAIDEVKQTQGKFGPQTCFVAGDDQFFMAVDSAKKQLDRIGISDAAGLTLKFEKVDIGQGRTAINISQVQNQPTSGPKGKVQPFDQPVPPVEAHPDSPAGKGPLAAMLQAHKWTLENVAPLYVAKGIPLSMDALAACAHSLFIQSTR